LRSFYFSTTGEVDEAAVEPTETPR
jgi:hypothetical protein